MYCTCTLQTHHFVFKQKYISSEASSCIIFCLFWVACRLLKNSTAKLNMYLSKTAQSGAAIVCFSQKLPCIYFSCQEKKSIKWFQILKFNSQLFTPFYKKSEWIKYSSVRLLQILFCIIMMHYFWWLRKPAMYRQSGTKRVTMKQFFLGGKKTTTLKSQFPKKGEIQYLQFFTY